MADIHQKSRVWQSLTELARDIEGPAVLVGDEETLVLAQTLAWSLTAVKEPARRAQLLRAIELLKEIPTDADLYEQVDKII
jgi:hypothetical protein